MNASRSGRGKAAGLLLVLGAGALPATGCSADTSAERGAREPLVRDSAGVRTVVNFEPRWGPGEEWRISEEPVLRIGMVDGAEEYLFDRIRGVTRLSDGTIVVLNAGDSQLRYFAPDGRHLRSVGRSGQGPGEMISPRWIDRLEGDTVQVTHTYGRVRYAPDGTLVGDDRLRWDRIHTVSRLAAFEGSAGFLMESCELPTPLFLGDKVLLCGSTYTDVRFLPDRPGLHHRRALVARSDWALESLDTIGIFARSDLIRYSAGGRLQTAALGPPYGPRGRMQVSGSPPRLIYTDLRSYRIELHSFDGSGRVLAIEREGALRAPTEFELESFDRAFQASSLFGRVLREQGNPASYRGEVTPVDSLSILIGAPFLDDLGAVWALVYPPGEDGSFGIDPGDPERVHDIFDAEGFYLGQIILQRGIVMHEIGADYLLGVTRDDLGVEYVVKHRLEGRE
jgi:hypothetical protein